MRTLKSDSQELLVVRCLCGHIVQLVCPLVIAHLLSLVVQTARVLRKHLNGATDDRRVRAHEGDRVRVQTLVPIRACLPLQGGAGNGGPGFPGLQRTQLPTKRLVIEFCYFSKGATEN